MAVYAWVLEVMDEAENAVFGAGDTEPRAYLANWIESHFKAKYGQTVRL